MKQQNKVIIKKTITCALMIGLLLPTHQSQGFGIEAKGIFKTYGQPVHETITTKAIIDSGILNSELVIGSTSEKGKQLILENRDQEIKQEQAIKYILQGIRFNDDPEGYLLEGTEANLNGGSVIGFATKFLSLSKKKKNNDPTKASHFGDFQYLHAMGTAGMKAVEIKKRINLYIYHCWRMATEENSFENFKKDYQYIIEQSSNFTFNQQIVKSAAELFPKDVLMFHATNQIQFQYRALGSLLHVIQDSYSKGHVVRVGWEEGHNSGKIRYFEDYSQQESTEHSHYDNLPKGKVNSESVFQISGSAIAYERTKQFLELVANNCAWTAGARESLGSKCETSVYGFIKDVVFALEENVSEEDRMTHSHPELLKKEKIENEIIN